MKSSNETAAKASGKNRLRTDTFATSVFILLAVTLVQRTVGFGRGILLGRWLSPEELGQWDLTYSFLLLAAPLAVLGVPGSFGRYAEQFRQRGQLRTFLKRSMLWTSICCVAATLLIAWGAAFFSDIIFNSQQHVNLTVGIAYCLAAIILHHTLTALLTAMRLYRVVSAMTFAQSMLFAIVALTLVWRSPTTASVLIGYGLACLISSLGALVWAWPGLREIDQPQESVAHNEFWPKLLRFAFFVWVSNLLSHLFAIIDRSMLVHYSGMSPAEAWDQIGQYHTSRIVPMLLVSFADLLGGLLLPHLSADWETGKKEEVSKRLNLTLKLTSLGMLCFGAAVLVTRPFLFGVLLEGKYALGATVLPWTLAGCVWFGLYSISQNYMWCAEKTRLATVPLMWGVGANVTLNLILLPQFGLYGAVLATASATFVCFVASLRLNGQHGMQVDAGTWLMIGVPAVLGLGIIPTALALLGLTFALLATNLVLTETDRRDLAKVVAAALAKFMPSRRATSAATS
ncbi:lipopolysaccharide biosynthesis protein [Adhaeretor mobilis]|uniref:MurJ-like flippase n=1 Tax=Adhaeretor mobilis TaxID=1930276 RepID=A0A517MXC9_9BACT|nr:oligosaccharide flippase family protein [Adhaeretor mobilis]QDS99538.1 MurJ-like flippase [Adhaeretor mobilis]